MDIETYPEELIVCFAKLAIAMNKRKTKIYTCDKSFLLSGLIKHGSEKYQTLIEKMREI